jgi:opacity protein-like surface antigen
LNLSDFGGNDVMPGGQNDYTLRRGGAVAIWSQVELHEVLSLRLEFLHTTKGANFEVAGIRSDTIRVRYIEIPILARATVPISEFVLPYLVAGPAVAVMHSSNEDNTSRFDFGLMAGIGADWKLSRPWLVSVDIRYEHGMTTLDADEQVDIRNRALFFMLGVGRAL